MARRSFRPLVSVVVVDYKLKNALLEECLSQIGKQTYRNYEIILLTDYPVGLFHPKLRKKAYGHYVGPAKKRDDGAKRARGEIVAFIDDDAYPNESWLVNIVRHFKNPRVAAVGGPGVTPPGSSWSEQASGWFSASPVGGGPYAHRFIPGKLVDVDDYPSMNLAVRKSDFLAVGGFDSNYWPGEDTKLCLDLTHKLEKRIIYEPKALVYHHRRPLWWPHLRQNGNFGIHRGYFARVLPETSARPVYFAPSIMFLGLVYLIVSFGLGKWFPEVARLQFVRTTTILGVVAFLVYFLLLCLNGVWISKRSKSILLGIISVPVTLVTHLWYGARFIQGFFSPRITENANQ